MNNPNFEVHQQGTAVELKFLRDLANEIVFEAGLPQHDLESFAKRIEKFYQYHNEKHPQ